MGKLNEDFKKVMVCDKCLQASCWHGEIMCYDAFTAGTKVLRIGDLRRLAYEHPDNWSDEKMIQIYGNADRDFA